MKLSGLINYFEKAIRWIASSFDNHTKGASSKKLVAFWLVVIITTPVHITWLVWAYKHNDWSHLEGVIWADFALISGCIGLNVWDKKITSKNDPGNTSSKVDQGKTTPDH